MAQNKDYRDPKVTTTGDSGGNAMKWVWIAIAVIVVLAILAWILGWFDTTTVEPVPTVEPTVEQAPVVVE